MAPAPQDGDRLADMLMAAATVGAVCAAAAQALKQAGLEYLLLDETQAENIRNNARKAARQIKTPEARAPLSPPPLARGRRNQEMVPPDESPPRREAPVFQAMPDPAVWPASWRECFQKTRAAPIIWTYWELGRDLRGTPDPERREFLRELLQDLAHPPGTHSFWPTALPGRNEAEKEMEAAPAIFWEGVRLLRGRAVMIMGSRALRSLALPEMRPYQQRRHQGRLLVVLPDMPVQETQRARRLREFLRQTLAPFI